MKVISAVGCIILILLSFGSAAASDIATVHGVAYEWNTFEPLDNAIIEINSTPTQSIIAKNGTYSVGLANGTYKITARYYENQQLVYYAEDSITVSHQGSYVRDLLLIPSYSSSENDTGTFLDLDVADMSSSGVSYKSSYIMDFILVLIAILFLVIYIIKHNLQRHLLTIITKKNNRPDNKIINDIHAENTDESHVETKAMGKNEINTDISKTDSDKGNEDIDISPDEPVPADLQQILDILKSQGGRMTQKDIRKRLKYSEGKVSLMLLDLERRGKIQKFKKGRGNIIFIVESNQ
jgi:uncharacterized membrane protein